MPALNVQEANFETEVLRSELPVLIDFHADWCQPCKVQSPIVEEVARELEGKLKVVKIDVDRSPRVAASFRVQSIPQLFVVDQGQVVAHHERGLADKQTILKLVRPFLPRSGNELKPDDLAQLMQQRRAVPVDLREPTAYSRYRIPGAVNIPLSEAKTRTKDLLPSDGRVRVLYARTGDDARELAETLGKQGVQVGWLAGGFLHWEADGLPIERGN
jgi:thioredoxin 1/putative thioredoxin